MTKIARHALAELEHLNLFALSSGFPDDNPPVATYHSATTSSMIDYTFMALTLFNRVQSFQLGNRTESDHLPQEIMIESSKTKLAQLEDNPISTYTINNK